MARIGLENFRYGKLTENNDGTFSYSAGLTLAKAISCNVSISNNEAKLYADNVLAESDTGFQSGTVTLGIDDENMAVMADLLGHTYSDSHIVRNSNDVAPYVGIGRILTIQKSNVRYYKVEFLYKVKFAEPSNEENTKGESVEFGTSSIEGTVATLMNGNWSEAKMFDTHAEAVTYLESLFANPISATVSFDANGGEGEIADIVTTVGATIVLPQPSALTPPTGKVLAGWDTYSQAEYPDIIGVYYTVTGTVTLYAIWADA